MVIQLSFSEYHGNRFVSENFISSSASFSGVAVSHMQVINVCLYDVVIYILHLFFSASFVCFLQLIFSLVSCMCTRTAAVVSDYRNAGFVIGV